MPTAVPLSNGVPTSCKALLASLHDRDAPYRNTITSSAAARPPKSADAEGICELRRRLFVRQHDARSPAYPLASSACCFRKRWLSLDTCRRYQFSESWLRVGSERMPCEKGIMRSVVLLNSRCEVTADVAAKCLLQRRLAVSRPAR